MGAGVAVPTVVGGGVWAAAAAMGDTVGERRLDLQNRMKELAKQRRVLAQESKADERKRSRLMERARGLSNGDLLSILGQRAAAKQRPEPKVKAKAKSHCKAKAKARASAAPPEESSSGAGGGSDPGAATS